MTPLEVGVKRFLDVLVSAQGESGTTDVYVSHDAVIAPLLAAVLGVQRLPEIWPAFLEGAFFGLGTNGLDVIWRGLRRSVCRRKGWPA